ncbi:hypothetical protein [Rufibacter psychrotolerans]|uniref:hypothetical protein n=1 Tax=Rufibacter psychrotolerans TaxID=2812556 RepID=UPI0019680A0D|nr:hypothetical protein [Rufibacter sp. SYSU D00308]
MEDFWERHDDEVFISKITEMMELHYLLERFNVTTYLDSDYIVCFDDSELIGSKDEYAITVITYYLSRIRE